MLQTPGSLLSAFTLPPFPVPCFYLGLLPSLLRLFSSVSCCSLHKHHLVHLVPSWTVSFHHPVLYVVSSVLPCVFSPCPYLTLCFWTLCSRGLTLLLTLDSPVILDFKPGLELSDQPLETGPPVCFLCLFGSDFFVVTFPVNTAPFFFLSLSILVLCLSSFLCYFIHHTLTLRKWGKKSCNSCKCMPLCHQALWGKIFVFPIFWCQTSRGKMVLGRHRGNTC